MRRTLLLAPLLLAACADQETAEDAALIKAARIGMNAVRGLPGGKQATFTAVRLVGASTVCGQINGNDGDGPRPFVAKGQEVEVADAHDPAIATRIAAACAGQPVHEITSRNAQFTDLSVAH